MRKSRKTKSNKNYLIEFGIIFLILVLIQGIFLLFGTNIYKIALEKISKCAGIVSSVLTIQTNDYRKKNNQSELAVSELLSVAAKMKAEDMAEGGYFSHSGPDGEEPWVWFDKVGYDYGYAGENLAVNYSESSDVTEGWINSAKHNANLLNTNFTEIGIGTAEGKYKGRNTTYIVQFFGKPFTPAESSDISVLESEVSQNNDPVQNPDVSVPDIDPIVLIKPSVQVEEETTPIISVAPTIPVVTKASLPKGEVLGAEKINMTPSSGDDQVYLFLVKIIITIISIFFCFLLIRRVILYFKK